MLIGKKKKIGSNQPFTLPSFWYLNPLYWIMIKVINASGNVTP